MLDWDMVLVVIAGYLAVTSLTKLLQSHRHRVLRELQRQVEIEQRQQESQRADPEPKKTRSA